MTHGIYKIVLKKPDGGMFEYYGVSHPTKGEVLELPGGNVWEVLSVTHKINEEWDGGKLSYYSLDYVQLEVGVK